MESYGFIYVWRDKKHKRLYIGCHWGTETDGYICSSKNMRDDYQNRPRDFRRKVIQRIYTNRQDLLDLEHNWLQLIEDHELGTKFYNKSKHRFGHWASQEDRDEIIKVIARQTKIAIEKDPSIVERQKASRKRKRQEGWEPRRGFKASEETRELISSKTRDHISRNPEFLENLLDKGIRNPETRAKARGTFLRNSARMSEEERSARFGTTKGKRCVTNGSINRFITQNESIPDGWWLGKTKH